MLEFLSSLTFMLKVGVEYMVFNDQKGMYTRRNAIRENSRSARAGSTRTTTTAPLPAHATAAMEMVGTESVDAQTPTPPENSPTAAKINAGSNFQPTPNGAVEQHTFQTPTTTVLILFGERCVCLLHFIYHRGDYLFEFFCLAVGER